MLIKKLRLALMRFIHRRDTTRWIPFNDFKVSSETTTGCGAVGDSWNLNRRSRDERTTFSSFMANFWPDPPSQVIVNKFKLLAKMMCYRCSSSTRHWMEWKRTDDDHVTSQVWIVRVHSYRDLDKFEDFDEERIGHRPNHNRREFGILLFGNKQLRYVNWIQVKCFGCNDLS